MKELPNGFLVNGCFPMEKDGITMFIGT